MYSTRSASGCLQGNTHPSPNHMEAISPGDVAHCMHFKFKRVLIGTSMDRGSDGVSKGISSAALPLFFLALALWCMHVFFIQNLNLTGDEVRYLAYGLGISNGEGFCASDESWRRMLEDGKIRGVSETSPTQVKGQVIHSVVYPLIGAFFIGAWQLDGARWLSFAVGLVGMMALFCAIRARFSENISLISLAAIVFACPLLFYFRLFFSEIFLFMLNSIMLWIIIKEKHRSFVTALCSILFICTFPFVHLKLSLECVAFFLIVFFHFCNSGAPKWQKVVLFVAPAIMFAAFIGHNYILFGAFIGGASPAFKSSLDAIPDRVLVNLFDYRHGLISNAPHLLLAFVGFILISRGADRQLKQVAVIFLAYFFTMLWANGSESYAGRNWVAATPFLAFGFARWLESGKRWNLVLASPLFVLSGCLLCLMLQRPNLFLDNRTYALPYDELFKIIKYFHFGYLLPYDFLDHTDAKIGSALQFGVPVFLLCSVFVLGQVLLAYNNQLGIVPQITFLSVVLFFSFVNECDGPAKIIIADGDKYFANVKLKVPEEIAFVKIDNNRAGLKQYGFFSVAVGDLRKMFYFNVKASPVVPVNLFHVADSISIAEKVSDPQRVWMNTAYDVKVYKRCISMFSTN